MRSFCRKRLRICSLLQQYLKERKKGRVRVHGPRDTRVADMVRLAVENLHEVETHATLDEAFKRMLHLKEPPKRIEMYDISHTHGRTRPASWWFSRISSPERMAIESFTSGRQGPRTMWA